MFNRGVQQWNPPILLQVFFVNNVTPGLAFLKLVFIVLFFFVNFFFFFTF